MADIKLTCRRCGAEIEHVCHTTLAQETKKLYDFVPYHQPDDPDEPDGHEPYPFFSEAYLYNLIGKDDARSVLGYVAGLLRAAGIDPDSV
jgi:hypothetical protein